MVFFSGGVLGREDGGRGTIKVLTIKLGGAITFVAVLHRGHANNARCAL